MKKGKWKEKVQRWNLDKKLCWYITCLICLMAVFIFLIATGWYFSLMNKQIRQMTKEQMIYLAETYDNTLNTYRNQVTALTLDDSVEKYLNEEETEDSIKERVQNLLANMLNMNSQANFAAIMDFDNNYVYKGNVVQMNPLFLRTMQEDYENSMEIRSGVRINYGNAFSRNEEKTLTIYWPIYSSHYLNKKLGILCVNYEESFWDQLFMEEETYGFESDIFLLDELGWLLPSQWSGKENYFEKFERMTGNAGSFMYHGVVYTYQRVGKWRMYLVSRVSLLETFGSYSKIVPAIALVLIVICLCSILIVNQFIRKLYQPMYEMVGAMNQVAKGQLQVRLNSENSGEDVQKIFQGFNYMMDRVNALIIEVKEEQKLKEQLKFQTLQSQIQPHFLYNTLECIHWQSLAEGAKDVSTMVKALAKYYRGCLSGGKDIITLPEELEMIHNYLIIQNMRYDNIITYKINQEEWYDQVKIPKMTLQPLVENSIYHGIRKENIQEGFIQISAVRKEKGVSVIVYDNGSGMSKEELEQLNHQMVEGTDGIGYGVCNVNKRIKLLFGKDYGLYYEQNINNGITVKIDLPMNQGNEA